MLLRASDGSDGRRETEVDPRALAQPSLSTVIVPPMFSTSAWVIARPSPVPDRRPAGRGRPGRTW